ncbi:hypothetical protein KW800_03145 [Candidatus Parcubacteria bacterium]|nr:hypothetical protein [Candidatus Parcubacteria bacterium]
MKGEKVLIIDIESGSTGCAFVHTNKSGTPTLKASVRTPYLLSDKPQSASMQSAMLDSLKTSLSSIFPMLGGAVDKVLISFSSPWLTTHLKTVIVSDDRSFVLDHRMIKKIISEEEELFRARLKESFHEESQIFESALTNLYLNGYQVDSPMKDKVKRAEMSFVLSATTKDLLWRVENELIRTVGVKKGAVLQSFMFAFFKVLSNSYQNLHSALLINMTQEVTDILFLRYGASAMNASLPFGPASVARSLAARLSIPLELAYSHLAIFARGDFDDSLTKLMDEALVSIEESWKRLWSTMGESIPEGKNVPYAVFLIAPKGFETFVKTFLESVLGGRSIIVLGETNSFSRELVQMSDGVSPDEKHLILASFSNLLE